MLQEERESGKPGYSPDRQAAAARGCRSNGRGSPIVAAILIAALLAQRDRDPRFPEPARYVCRSPGSRSGAVILLAAPLRQPDWRIMPETFKGTIFLLALITRGVDDAGREAAGRILADRARARLRVGGVRQHPADCARARAGRLRLGLSRLYRGLRRLDDLVRILRRAVRSPTCIRRRKSVGRWVRHGWHVAPRLRSSSSSVMLLVLGPGIPTRADPPGAPRRRRSIAAATSRNSVAAGSLATSRAAG